MSYSFEELTEGLSASFEKVVTEQDVQTFAQVTGDTNPVHLDADYAATTSFEKPIAHGMLTAGFISAAIGTKLPGPGCIYLEQSLKFRAPVFIGATVTTTVTVKELNERRRRAVLETVCTVEGKKVVTGEATIMLP
ncbi:MAG: acyl dehydratase [Marinomonas sp.]|uniref:3-hydroxybutyryl-CoA dehydratase n=1 Tax=Marinomonas communis TaxID=28254 RepID=A0A4R6XB36_9GAMM|nr:MaoC family dehydratase [Marinomonas communis]MAF16853.1 acyl dehydratase [Marinomonas sp.]RUM55456.1 MAG: acyl dehydratase [Marinomonas sp.]RUM55999.1 MAG: acyl dehydratase [Marinomonas sp.]TDR15279.1 3-hydroxybutyryl-CoA dehydratase [Marinomonas communis]